MFQLRLLICVLLCLLGMGCSKGDASIEDWMNPDGKLKVLSTTAIIDDVVGRIGKDRMSIYL
ncbi:MAG: hypothetical protein LVR00_07450 [Rhabdochlamydiaceae bacterium]